MIMFGKTKKLEKEIKNLYDSMYRLESRIFELEKKVLYYKTGNKTEVGYIVDPLIYKCRVENIQNEYISLDVAIKTIIDHLKVKFKKMPKIDENYILVKDTK